MCNHELKDYFWAGKRVRLRPLSETDAEAGFAESFDSETRQLLQLGIELPTSVAAQREKLAEMAKLNKDDGFIVLAIDDLSGTLVGTISMHSWNPKNGTFGFGVSIRRKHRGKGYATEAVRILLQYAFHERRFQKCNSACIEGNEASIALHKKLGFSEEGRRRRNFFMNGRYYDDLLFGLTSDEFDATLS